MVKVPVGKNNNTTVWAVSRHTAAELADISNISRKCLDGSFEMGLRDTKRGR
jgi:hypothetical protein